MLSLNQYVNIMHSEVPPKKLEKIANKDRLCLTKFQYPRKDFDYTSVPGIGQTGTIVLSHSYHSKKGKREFEMLVQERGLFEQFVTLIEIKKDGIQGVRP